MKQLFLLASLLAMMSFAACSPHLAPDPPIGRTTATAVAAARLGTGEAAVRDVVERFGRRLQNVSLLAPDAAQQMQAQYAGLVSPALLQNWMSDPLRAPGRAVSSPWPDRIDVDTVTQEGADRYTVTGSVIEVTSVEVLQGGTAAQVPVRIVVQKDGGVWLITEYTRAP